MAMLIPAAEAAAGSSWWGTLLTGAGGILLCWIQRREPKERWMRCLQCIGAGILLGEFLHSTHIPWPGEKTEYAVPLILLLLAEQAAERGTEKAARSVNCLRWIIFGVIGIVLLSGVKEIEWNEYPKQSPNTALLPIMLLPMMGNQKQSLRQGVGILVYLLAGGWIITNVTGQQGNMYELSRSISVLGTSLRFESIMAVAMTIGYYALSTWLLCADGVEEKTGTRICSLIAAVWYLSGIRIHSILVAALMILLWGILPHLPGGERKKKKLEKRC